MGKKEREKKERARREAQAAKAKQDAAAAAAAAESGGALSVAQDLAALKFEGTSAADPAVVEPEPETREAVLARHKKEARDLATKMRKKFKKVKKGKEAALEAEAAEKEQEMQERHAAELSQFPAEDEGEEAEAVAAAAAKAQGGSDAASALAEAEQEDEGEMKRRKAREKAQRKRDRQRAAEAEREKRIADEKAGMGPLPRDVESSAIAAQLAQAGGGPFRIHEVASDGHCMYRALAHQLGARGRLGEVSVDPAGSHLELRKRAAAHMRSHAPDFKPFCAEADFGAYCDKVQGTAEWGGQMELQALCHCLRAQVHVYRADAAEPIVMGAEYSTAGSDMEPLRLTYHLHYYAMGEHYNAVERLSSS